VALPLSSGRIVRILTLKESVLAASTDNLEKIWDLMGEVLEERLLVSEVLSDTKSCDIVVKFGNKGSTHLAYEAH
jgi:hypothetical protein